MGCGRCGGRRKGGAVQAGGRTADVLMGLGFEAGVCVHGEGEQLFEGRECTQEHDDDAAAFHCLDGARQQVRRDALEILQQHGDWMHANKQTRDALAACACLWRHARCGGLCWREWL